MGLLRSTTAACVFALVSFLASPISAAVLQNYTIALPKGSSDHGQPGLLCTPAKAIDLLTFYLLNYVAHAATVLTRPGERADDYLVSVFGSLLFPSLGLYRGIEAILSGAVFARNDDLRKAARSGALCVVTRGPDWRPKDGESVSDVILKRHYRPADNGFSCGTEAQMHEEITKKEGIHLVTYSPPYIFTKFGCPVFVHRRIIHGTYILPAGYRFAIVPHDTQFQTSTESTPGQPIIEVSATYNMVKALVALAQSAYALYTLYRARGDQINQFGYAAFGLTVAPYAVMSMMNLTGNLCRPEYPSLYLVESSIMDEARKRGGLFKGFVARVKEENRTVSCCGCAYGEDIDDLHFTANHTGDIIANYTTARRHWSHTNEPTSTQPPHTPHFNTTTDTNPTTCIEKPSPSTPSPDPIRTSHSDPILPLPKKLNYHNINQPLMLFIPCHPPIIRTTTPSPLHTLKSFHLHRIWLIIKYSLWTQSYHPSPFLTRAHHWRLLKYLLTSLVSLTPILLVGLLSHFQRGSIPAAESSTWRAFAVQWLCCGSVTGLWFVFDQERKDAVPNGEAQVGPGVRAFLYVTSAAPAVGGYVVVGQMVVRYGVCAWVGD